MRNDQMGSTGFYLVGLHIFLAPNFATTLRPSEQSDLRRKAVLEAPSDGWLLMVLETPGAGWRPVALRWLSIGIPRRAPIFCATFRVGSLRQWLFGS